MLYFNAQVSAYDKQLACDAHYPDTSSYQFRQ